MVIDITHADCVGLDDKWQHFIVTVFGNTNELHLWASEETTEEILEKWLRDEPVDVVVNRVEANTVDGTARAHA